MPGEGVILGDQHVRDAVAGQVDEAQIGVVPIQHRDIRGTRGTLPSRRPAFGRKSPARRREVDEIQVAVAGDVHQMVQPVGAPPAPGCARTVSVAPNRPSPRLGL